MKENYGWLNPCLFGEGEEIPLDPMSPKGIITDLLEELITTSYSLMQEGGAYTNAIGEPVDTEDSAIGRACKYLKLSIPTVPPW